MNAIHTENIKKAFGENDVLKGINLTIRKGEIFTLLGENGSGKTTLINILSTLSKADDGEAVVLGFSLQKEPGKIRKYISLNAQTNTLDDEFSGYENLKLVAELRGIKQVDQEIKHLAERLDLSSFLKRKVGTYSGGMRRRLDLAMSLLGDPELIFLDEPTTGVDPKNRLEIWKIIEEIRDSGKTIFLTTQYLEEADHLSDHIAFIHGGKIVLYGTPEEIKQNTAELFDIQVASDDYEKAKAVLLEVEDVVAQQEPTFTVRHSQQALKQLVDNGVTVEAVRGNHAALETIFLNVTEGRN